MGGVCAAVSLVECAGRVYLALIARFIPVRLLGNPTRCNWRLGRYAPIVPLGTLTVCLFVDEQDCCAHFTKGESQGLKMAPNIGSTPKVS